MHAPTLSLPRAPAAALDDTGRPQYGAYAGEVPGVAAVGRNGGILVRATRYKRWSFVWVTDDRVAAGIAVADVGYLGQAFVYGFDRLEKSEAQEQGWLSPAGLNVRHVGGLADLSARAWSGEKRVEIRAEGRGIRAVGELGSIACDVRIESLDTPLTVMTDLYGQGCPAATVKTAGVAATGSVSFGGKKFELSGALASVDLSAGRFPYRMKWNWGSCAARDVRGRAIGLNLCRGVHEDIQGRWTENALWLDGQPGALPPLRFEVGARPGDPWRVRSAGGEVELELRPHGERRAEVNLALIASRFRHPYGTFHGRVRDLDGRSIELDGACGMVEDHEARW